MSLIYWLLRTELVNQLDKNEHQAAKIERLKDENANLEVNAVRLRGADKLAYYCAKAIERREIGSRSAIGDALLSYLDIGGMDGPSNVPVWVEQYEAAEAKEESDD